MLESEQAQIDREVRTKLNLLQIAIEESAAVADVVSEQPAANTVAVVAVVDSYFLADVGAEEEAGTGDDAAALRRERLVRQELNNRLVQNSLIEVIHPAQDSVAKARDEIIAGNSAALHFDTTKEIGKALGADVLVCVLIDEAGDEVNVVAMQVPEGTLIYQDTIKHWDLLTEANEQAAEEGP
jgi:hypothetical protein